MSTRFILVRHGQTEWNRIERFRGRADIPLNDTGLEQARRIAQHLSREPFVAVYAGPLQRTLATAEPIAEAKHLSVQPLAGLMDIDFGAWQGLTPEEAAARYPDDYSRWLDHPAQVHFPGGESLNQVRVRAMTAIRNLAKMHDGETVVLVGHRIANKVILCAVLGLSNSAVWRIEQDNGAVNRFEFRDGVWIIQSLNDTCHLS
jgi:broad specificity phosphatase PhoE